KSAPAKTDACNAETENTNTKRIQRLRRIDCLLKILLIILLLPPFVVQNFKLANAKNQKSLSVTLLLNIGFFRISSVPILSIFRSKSGDTYIISYFFHFVSLFSYVGNAPVKMRI